MDVHHDARHDYQLFSELISDMCILRLIMENTNCDNSYIIMIQDRSISIFIRLHNVYFTSGLDNSDSVVPDASSELKIIPFSLTCNQIAMTLIGQYTMPL